MLYSPMLLRVFARDTPRSLDFSCDRKPNRLEYQAKVEKYKEKKSVWD